MNPWQPDPSEEEDVDELLEYIDETLGGTPKGRLAKALVETLAGRRPQRDRADVDGQGNSTTLS